MANAEKELETKDQKKPEKKKEKQLDDWADDVIKIFTVPKRKRLLNDERGLLSNEELMERITSILLLIACLLLMIATTLLAHMDFRQGPKVNSNTKRIVVRVPHVFIIYQGGLHLDFSTDDSISPSKNFKIKLRHSLPTYNFQSVFLGPPVGKSTGYLAYANDKRIYIFYTDGKKDITYIDIETGKHRTISNTSYGDSLMFGSGVRVGSNFFMAGDKNNINSLSWTVHTSKCFTWEEKREVLDRSKSTTFASYTDSCFASYNR